MRSACNRTEATALFTRGLADLDAIGSGDHAFTNELLWFAKSITAGPLPSENGSRLAKICELNVDDSRKFPWPLAAAASPGCWGTAYLAQLSRWHDRDKVTLDLTLPPALSFLVVIAAFVLMTHWRCLGLWSRKWGLDWDWDHLVESIMKAGPPALPTLLKELLYQFELAYPSDRTLRPSRSERAHHEVSGR